MTVIPIENIYYLLCYAWNKLEEKDRVAASIDDKTTLVNLFAKVLINAIKILLKRGLNKSYISCEDEIYGVKGKLNFSKTLKRFHLSGNKTICSFDEFTPDTILNQILITTVLRLVKTKGLDRELMTRLKFLKRMLPDIKQVELNTQTFRKIRLNRNNQFYSFVLDVCEIIYDCTLPSEKEGEFQFVDFTRDAKKMNKLFEEFVRNFYRLEQSNYKRVSSEIIRWKFDSTFEESYLPQMKTDITLENETQKIIIDAKFYSETMSSNFDRQKIHSANLYQLFSYLVNQEEKEGKTLYTTGILLYPTIEKEYDLQYRYNQHSIQIRTVNLNKKWKEISSRLLNIINIESN